MHVVYSDKLGGALCMEKVLWSTLTNMFFSLPLIFKNLYIYLQNDLSNSRWHNALNHSSSSPIISHKSILYTSNDFIKWPFTFTYQNIFSVLSAMPSRRAEIWNIYIYIYTWHSINISIEPNKCFQQFFAKADRAIF